MKIYTKTGDKGSTSLFTGTRVPKHHMRIESYGSIDELNSVLGLVRDQKIDNHAKKAIIKLKKKKLPKGHNMAQEPK